MTKNNKKTTKNSKAAGNKKTTKQNNSGSPKVKSEKTKAMQAEILSIVLIGLSLIMIVCVLTSQNTGTVGHYISNFLIKGFGIGAAVLPIVLLIFSIQTLFSDQKSNFKFKLFLFLGFFIVFISLAHILTMQELSDNKLASYIYYYYEHASLSNGGIIGSLIGGALYSLLGTLSYIVLVTALAVLLILATGKSIVGLLSYVGDIIDGVKDDYEDYIQEQEDYEDYSDDYEDNIDDKNVKSKQKDKKQENAPNIRNAEEVPKKTKKVKRKSKKVKTNNTPKAKNERLIALNLPDEDSSALEDAVSIQNDFILKNNEIYNKPARHDYKFTGLNELVNEAHHKKNSNEDKNLAFNLQDEVDKNIQTFNEKMDEEDFEFTSPRKNLAQSYKQTSDDSASQLSKAADALVEKVAAQSEPEFNDVNEDLPWESGNDEIAKEALSNINRQGTASPTPVKTSPSEASALDNFDDGSIEILEAEKTKTINKLKVDRTLNYKYPKLEFLGSNPKLNNSSTRHEMITKAKQLEETLRIFGVNANVDNISQGPAVTRYELTPPKGVRVKDIVNLENDIALALAARSIRMEAPIPGKSAIGIEIPNDSISMVYFREVLTNERFQNFKGKLAFGVGKDITGNVIVQDIAKMPHLLIAGSTGSGKSVCINTLITSILYKYSPEQVKLIMIDPKIVELGVYNGIPHLLVPVVTDPQKAAGALNWAVREMMRRYDLFATRGVRNLEGYNNLNDIEEKIPQMVVIIDELADLMMVVKKDVEASIQRLTQLARAAGIHLVIATQRPSVNVITGVIKANVPSRIAFKVASSTDSRTILDASGAEKLLGKGDMLFQAGDMDKPLRIQGAFVTDQEIEKIVSYIRVEDEDHYDQSIINEINSVGKDDSSGSGGSISDSEDSDELIDEVIRFVTSSGKASTSLIQRKFRIGFNRAARIIDELEERGIVGPDKGGTKGRDVLMSKDEYSDWNSRHQDY